MLATFDDLNLGIKAITPLLYDSGGSNHGSGFLLHGRAKLFLMPRLSVV